MESRSIKDFLRRLWKNYVFRNVVLFVGLVVLFLVAVSLLLNLFTRHNKYRDVPDFAGYTMEEADRLARKDRLRLEVNDSLFVPLMDPGVILEQRPAAGTQVKSGRRIFVTLNSFRQKMVTVPYVAEYSLRQAKNILETSGLGIARLEYVDAIATNYVLRQYVGKREVTAQEPVQAEYGSDVVLVVGRQPGADRVVTPRVVGLTLREAGGRLLEAGLNVGRPVNDNDINPRNLHSARVYKQSPEQGSYARLGSTTTLYLSLDSLVVVKGAAASDAAAQKFTTERTLTDSLRREGYSGERLSSEAEWLMKVESGEVSPEDITRRMEELAAERRSAEKYNDSDYIGEEVPLHELDAADREADITDGDEGFFF